MSRQVNGTHPILPTETGYHTATHGSTGHPEFQNQLRVSTFHVCSLNTSITDFRAATESSPTRNPIPTAKIPNRVLDSSMLMVRKSRLDS